MTVTIEGQPSSEQIRADLAAAGEPVLLAFSRGKDSVAAWLALRDAGVAVVPYHMYSVPGLDFVARDLARWSEYFGQEIIDLPHPSVYRWLNNLTFQAPENCAIIEAAQMPTPSYDDILALLREDLGMPGAWVADGVRAADSPVRRLSMATHGVRKAKSRKVSVVWDWRVAEVRDRIAAEGLTLGPDYDWFGRSFDGIDYRFLAPLKEHAPDDYQRVLDWFPLAELELVRHGL